MYIFKSQQNSGTQKFIPADWSQQQDSGSNKFITAGVNKTVDPINLFLLKSTKGGFYNLFLLESTKP